jgi:5-methylcytosine-specific restriction endonuclease McrA
MQDDSSIQDAAAARLNALRAEMIRFAVREEAYRRRVWQAAHERDLQQDALDQEEARARQEERRTRPTSRSRENAWFKRLRNQARRRVAEIILRDGYACRYCGTTTRRLELDHIHPLSRGGSNDNDNLALACGSCNASKNNLTLDEWRAPTSPYLS